MNAEDVMRLLAKKSTLNDIANKRLVTWMELILK